MNYFISLLSAAWNKNPPLSYQDIIHRHVEFKQECITSFNGRGPHLTDRDAEEMIAALKELAQTISIQNAPLYFAEMLQRPTDKIYQQLVKDRIIDLQYELLWSYAFLEKHDYENLEKHFTEILLDIREVIITKLAEEFNQAVFARFPVSTQARKPMLTLLNNKLPIPEG